MTGSPFKEKKNDNITGSRYETIQKKTINTGSKWKTI